METKCVDIRVSLKTFMKRADLPQDLFQRLQSLRGIILRLYQSNLHSVWVEDLLRYFEVFINEIANNSLKAIESKLEKLETQTLSSLVTDLKIPVKTSKKLYTQSVKKSKKKARLCEILPKFISEYLKLTIKKNSLAKDEFENCILSVFDCFKIPYNFYVEALANKYLGDSKTYNISKLEDFLSLFFGSIENYKFYVKISRVVESFKFPIANGTLPFSYRITLTSLKKCYTGNQNTLVEGQSLDITPLGVNDQNKRGDKLVIFGRHPGSDIVLPADEKEIDYAALILLNLPDNVYAVDISKKTNIGFKLENGKFLHLRNGMLLNLAKTTTFYIENISFTPRSQEGDVDGEDVVKENEFIVDSHVNLQCVEGIYKGFKFFLTTKAKDSEQQKLVYGFGSGVEEEATDVFIPRESGLSRKHLEFLFDSDSKEWNVNDNKSTNGSYLLFKNFEKWSQRKYSDLQIVFDDIKLDTFKEILIGRYVFSLRIVN